MSINLKSGVSGIILIFHCESPKSNIFACQIVNFFSLKIIINFENKNSIKTLNISLSPHTILYVSR